MSQREQEKKIAEDKRLREERDRKIQEHKQRMKELTEAEYQLEDGKRAKAADEMMWLDFETRVRILIQKYIEPIINLSFEDREATLQVEMMTQKLDSRAQLLERAVFKVDNEKQTTIFDEYSEKMQNMSVFLHSEI